MARFTTSDRAPHDDQVENVAMKSIEKYPPGFWAPCNLGSLASAPHTQVKI